MKSDMADSQRAGERDRMVEIDLRRRGIADSEVLDAIGRVPREWFVPERESTRAYADAALPIECGQTISQPYIVARMLELLQVRREHRVLEIGTGSGYQTAILAKLARSVCTIEWHLKLALSAHERLDRLGVTNVELRCGDGSLGWAQRGPFDRIVVSAGGPQMPGALCSQLADGGRLVAPVGTREEQVLLVISRKGESFHRVDDIACRFVKLLGEEGWAE